MVSPHVWKMRPISCRLVVNNKLGSINELNGVDDNTNKLESGVYRKKNTNIRVLLRNMYHMNSKK